jgi:hypothetical protein
LGLLGKLLPIELYLHHLQQEGDIVVVEVSILLELRNLRAQVLNFHHFALLLGVFA